MSLEVTADRTAVIAWAQEAVESAGLDKAMGRSILAFLLTAPRVARGFARFCGTPDPLRGAGVPTAYYSTPTLRFIRAWDSHTRELCLARGIESWRVTTIELK